MTRSAISVITGLCMYNEDAPREVSSEAKRGDRLALVGSRPSGAGNGVRPLAVFHASENCTPLPALESVGVY